MARLVKAGGADLMHLPNADGETARQICQERNDEMMKDKEVREVGYGRGRSGDGAEGEDSILG